MITKTNVIKAIRTRIKNATELGSKSIPVSKEEFNQLWWACGIIDHIQHGFCYFNIDGIQVFWQAERDMERELKDYEKFCMDFARDILKMERKPNNK